MPYEEPTPIYSDPSGGMGPSGSELPLSPGDLDFTDPVPEGGSDRRKYLLPLLAALGTLAGAKFGGSAGASGFAKGFNDSGAVQTYYQEMQTKEKEKHKRWLNEVEGVRKRIDDARANEAYGDQDYKDAIAAWDKAIIDNKVTAKEMQNINTLMNRASGAGAIEAYKTKREEEAAQRVIARRLESLRGEAGVRRETGETVTLPDGSVVPASAVFASGEESKRQGAGFAHTSGESALDRAQRERLSGAELGQRATEGEAGRRTSLAAAAMAANAQPQYPMMGGMTPAPRNVFPTTEQLSSINDLARGGAPRAPKAPGGGGVGALPPSPAGVEDPKDTAVQKYLDLANGSPEGAEMLINQNKKISPEAKLKAINYLNEYVKRTTSSSSRNPNLSGILESGQRYADRMRDSGTLSLPPSPER